MFFDIFIHSYKYLFVKYKYRKLFSFTLDYFTLFFTFVLKLCPQNKNFNTDAVFKRRYYGGRNIG